MRLGEMEVRCTGADSRSLERFGKGARACSVWMAACAGKGRLVIEGYASTASPRYAGGERRTKRMEWQDGGEFETPPGAQWWQKEWGVARGGESEAKALAGAGRGAVRA